mgnify:FL=1|tara:strand:- start:416 stop:658 length:243 start_codon:yes stop_codon:yes gene_type:complete
MGIRDNARKGKRAEDLFRFNKGLTSEDEVERTGIGSDFKVGDEYYEVKSGDAELSPRQEREKRRRGDNFHEVRYDNDVDY